MADKLHVLMQFKISGRHACLEGRRVRSAIASRPRGHATGELELTRLTILGQPSRSGSTSSLTRQERNCFNESNQPALGSSNQGSCGRFSVEVKEWRTAIARHGPRMLRSPESGLLPPKKTGRSLDNSETALGKGPQRQPATISLAGEAPLISQHFAARLSTHAPLYGAPPGSCG